MSAMYDSDALGVCDEQETETSSNRAAEVPHEPWLVYAANGPNYVPHGELSIGDE